MRAAILAISSALDRVCRRGAVLATALMVALIGVQVVARYVFSQPPAWTEEGARYAMVWAGLLGATAAFRGGFDPILTRVKRFEAGLFRPLGLALRAGAVLMFLGPLGYYCLFGPGADPARGYLARSAVRTAESLGVSMAWFTVALPLAITVILVHLVAQLVDPRPQAAAADPVARELL